MWLNANIVVRSLTSLCLRDGKPPLGQDRACSTENREPQEQLVGTLAGCQPYLRARASLNAPLWNIKPNSSKGIVVS